MRQYGPWIHAFANRIRTSTQTATDAVLLDNMLRAAEKVGYPRGKFIGRYGGGCGLLPWPIEAFLIEYCLGGKQSWLDVKLKPPMKLIENDLSRQRDPSVLDSKITSIFKKYFGADWHNVVNQQLPSNYVPRPIRRLMP